MKTDFLSVSREKKKPQVGFMVVWNGDMELERRGVEEEGREAPSDGCRREEGGGREGGRGRKGGRRLQSTMSGVLGTHNYT